MAEIGRRGLLRGLGTGAAALPGLPLAEARAAVPTAGDRRPDAAGVRQRLRLVVNGVARALSVDSRASLADVLRDALGLTGTHIGCDAGQCGACTVLVDGRRVLSCLTLALQAEGARVVTIEGLAAPGEPAVERLHPLQAAFAAHDAFQCGACTPGQIMSAVGCIAEGHAGSRAEIRAWMAGNLCRCGAYPAIVEAVASVAGTAG